MDDKKVKGSLLQDYVRMICANRDKEWDKYLEPEDWEIVDGRIMPSVWYPFETFQRCGLAVFQLLGGGDLKKVREWGRTSVEQLVKGAYKSLIADPDPMKALERFVLLRGQFFNYLSLELEKVEEKRAKIKMVYDPIDPANEPYCAQLMGTFARLAELTGGKNIKVDLPAKEWKGAPATIFDIRWD